MEIDRIGESHSYNVNVAIRVGVEKATLLKEIRYWCLQNYLNRRNIVGGLPFTYDTAETYGRRFPEFNPKSINRWLIELDRDGYVFSSKELNRHGRDRTKWFTVNFELYATLVRGLPVDEDTVRRWHESAALAISQNEKSTFLKMGNVNSQNEETLPSSTILLSQDHFFKSDRITAADLEEFDQGAASHSGISPGGELAGPGPGDMVALKNLVVDRIVQYFAKHPDQWQLMANNARYTGGQREIIDLWACKQQVYTLLNWEREVHKLGVFLHNAKNFEQRPTVSRSKRSADKGAPQYDADFYRQSGVYQS